MMWLLSCGRPIPEMSFDSATNYQFVHIANVNRDYAQVFEDVQETWRDPVMTGNTPQEFKKAMEKAKEYVDLHDLSCPLITVNSWNEWTETSYLEPDDLYGYGYLEAIRDVILK